MKLKLTVVKIKEQKRRKEREKNNKERQEENLGKRQGETLTGWDRVQIKDHRNVSTIGRLRSIARRINCEVRARLTSRTDKETSVDNRGRIRSSSSEHERKHWDLTYSKQRRPLKDPYWATFCFLITSVSVITKGSLCLGRSTVSHEEISRVLEIKTFLHKLHTFQSFYWSKVHDDENDKTSGKASQSSNLPKCSEGEREGYCVRKNFPLQNTSVLRQGTI